MIELLHQRLVDEVLPGAGKLDTGDADPEWLRQAQRQVLDDWWDQYGWGLSIFLPDTFGTDFFLTVVTAEDLRRWKGFRWDSGDVHEFGERIIGAYAQIGMDANEKMIVASDALDLPLILDTQEHFRGRIRVSYGWGTGLTNDLLDNVMAGDRWFGPMSRGGRCCGMEANGLAVQLTRTSASESEGWRISHHIEPALHLRSPSPKCGALRQALLAHSVATHEPNGARTGRIWSGP